MVKDQMIHLSKALYGVWHDEFISGFKSSGITDSLLNLFQTIDINLLFSAINLQPWS